MLSSIILLLLVGITLHIVANIMSFFLLYVGVDFLECHILGINEDWEAMTIPPNAPKEGYVTIIVTSSSERSASC